MLLLVIGLTVIVSLVAALALANWVLARRDTVLQSKSVAVARNVERIRYFDEALTMSARMNAATGDRSYERRYRYLAPQLDRVIADTVRIVGDRLAAAQVSQTGESNRRLVAMEMRSFALVRAGHHAEAYALLNNATYIREKALYAQSSHRALSRFVAVTGRQAARSALVRNIVNIATLPLLLLGAAAIAAYVIMNTRHWRAERVEHERLRELDRLKDEFVSLVSHELRTPLTSIFGYLELFVEETAGKLEATEAHFLDVVQRNAERLLHLVEDLLFVARIDSGRLELDEQEVDLGAIAADTVEAARPGAKRRQIEVRLLGSRSLPFRGDPARLGQLIDNLLSNALKFTPPGGEISLELASSGAGVRLVVADTGLGVRPDEIAHLFERFYRTEEATESAVQGTGLGLWISKAIVEAHGGTITPQSTRGVGTSFTIEFPLRPEVTGVDLNTDGRAAAGRPLAANVVLL